VQAPCPAGCKDDAKSVCERYLDLDEGCCESMGIQSVSPFLGASNSVQQDPKNEEDPQMTTCQEYPLPRNSKEFLDLLYP
jgi:hypothetical protein